MSPQSPAPAATDAMNDVPGGGKFGTTLGHPSPLWMLFMTEFWERFAFYSVSWALALYIVAHFYNGDPSGQAWASSIFGAYTALIYASSIFGGYVADKVIGYQRSILIGALVMALGLFVVMLPSEESSWPAWRW